MRDEPALSSAELRTPATLELTGLPPAMVEDILLRVVIAEGRPSMVRVAERLHCSVGVIEPIIGSLRERRLMEYEGMEGRSYLLSATEAGRAHSRARSAECRYDGPLPVPLDLYNRVVRAQPPTFISTAISSPTPSATSSSRGP